MFDWLINKFSYFISNINPPDFSTEGSAHMTVPNLEKFSETLPAGKGVAVQCKVQLTNVSDN